MRTLTSSPHHGNHVRKILWTVLDEPEEIFTWVKWYHSGYEEEGGWIRPTEEELGPCGANYEKEWDMTYFDEDDRIFPNVFW